MKKIINKILVCGFLLGICAMFSSCLILLDEEAFQGWEVTYEETTPAYSKVSIQNTCQKYGSDAAYISNVYYKSYSSEEWVECWNTGTGNPLYADSNCSFRLDEGRYYFCIRVVYPNLSDKYNYYDDYCTDQRIACAKGSTVQLKFDGDNFYRK